VKHAYLLPPNRAPQEIRLTIGDRVICVALCGLLLVLGFYPMPVYDWAAGAVEALLR
jgi:hypothetical protein